MPLSQPPGSSPWLVETSLEPRLPASHRVLTHVFRVCHIRTLAFGLRLTLIQHELTLTCLHLQTPYFV